MSFDVCAAEAAARKEVRLCQRMLAQGSPPYFWRRRLDRAAQQLYRAAEILRDQVETIDRGSP